MIFSIFFSLLSLGLLSLLSFLFLAVALCAVCSSCSSSPVLLGPGLRWRPGEEWWFFLQALLHVSRPAQDPAQRRGGCQIMRYLLSDVRPLYWTADSLTHFSISTVCVGGVWTFESKYCRAKHLNWMHPSLVRDGLDMKRHAFTSVPHRKGMGD